MDTIMHKKNSTKVFYSSPIQQAFTIIRCEKLFLNKLLSLWVGMWEINCSQGQTEADEWDTRSGIAKRTSLLPKQYKTNVAVSKTGLKERILRLGRDGVKLARPKCFLKNKRRVSKQSSILPKQ